MLPSRLEHAPCTRALRGRCADRLIGRDTDRWPLLEADARDLHAALICWLVRQVTAAGKRAGSACGFESFDVRPAGACQLKSRFARLALKRQAPQRSFDALTCAARGVGRRACMVSGTSARPRTLPARAARRRTSSNGNHVRSSRPQSLLLWLAFARCATSTMPALCPADDVGPSTPTSRPVTSCSGTGSFRVAASALTSPDCSRTLALRLTTLELASSRRPTDLRVTES